MAKGRKSVLDTKILPNIDLIRRMLENGSTEKEIYKAINVAHTQWFKYKEQDNEFSELFKTFKSNLVEDNTKRMTFWLDDPTVSVSDKLRTIEYMEKTRGKMMTEKDKQYFAHQRKLYELKMKEFKLKQKEVENNIKNPPTNIMIVEGTPSE